jgi:two-component system nitrate/nitrite response regulator NarL
MLELTVTRIVIATRVRLYREGLSRAFADARGCAVVAAVADTEEVGPLIEPLAPDVIVVEAGAEGIGELIHRLRIGPRPIPVVLLGVAEDPQQIIALAEAGVSGYVTRDDSVESTIDTVLSVARGEMPCSPLIASGLMQRLASVSRDQPWPEALDRLTGREREVLLLIEQGESNKEIAARLQIEQSTVKNHVSSILEKLGVQRRAQAAALLRRQTGQRAGALA